MIETYAPRDELGGKMRFCMMCILRAIFRRKAKQTSWAIRASFSIRIPRTIDWFLTVWLRAKYSRYETLTPLNNLDLIIDTWDRLEFHWNIPQKCHTSRVKGCWYTFIVIPVFCREWEQWTNDTLLQHDEREYWIVTRVQSTFELGSKGHWEVTCSFTLFVSFFMHAYSRALLKRVLELKGSH